MKPPRAKSAKPPSRKRLIPTDLTKYTKVTDVQKFEDFERSLRRTRPHFTPINNLTFPKDPNKAQVLLCLEFKYSKKYPNLRLDKLFEKNEKKPPVEEEEDSIPSLDDLDDKQIPQFAPIIAKRLGLQNRITPPRSRYGSVPARVDSNIRKPSVSKVTGMESRMMSDFKVSRRGSIEKQRLTNKVLQIQSINNDPSFDSIGESKKPNTPKFSPQAEHRRDKRTETEESKDSNPMNKRAASLGRPPRVTHVPKEVGNDDIDKFNYLYQVYKNPSQRDQSLENISSPQDEFLPMIREEKKSNKIYIKSRNYLLNRTVTGARRSPKRDDSRTWAAGEIDKFNSTFSNLKDKKGEKKVNSLFQTLMKTYNEVEKSLSRPRFENYTFEEYLKSIYGNNVTPEDAQAALQHKYFKIPV